MTLEFSKGQGTGNDFVLVSDPQGRLRLTPQQIRRLCDRRFGVGADGYIRATSAKNVPGYAQFGKAGNIPEETWFMDYWNADGSVAEMCGNGARVFVHFLIHKKLIGLDVGQSLKIGTRAGIKTVERIAAERYAIDMGPWSLRDPETVLRQGTDAKVRAFGAEDSQPAVSVDIGNPHTVVILDGKEQVDELDLTRPPAVFPAPAGGANTEFIALQSPLRREGAAQLTMRVHERGVGETSACGTGACAAAVAARLKLQRQRDAALSGNGNEPAEDFEIWDVAQPGGTTRIRFTITGDGAERIQLSGAAEIVFDGVACLP